MFTKKNKDQANENAAEKIVIIEDKENTQKKGVVRRIWDAGLKVIGLVVIFVIAVEFAIMQGPKAYDFVKGLFSNEEEEDTDNLIEAEMNNICEVAVYSYSYSNTKEDSNYRNIWKVSVPNTERSVSMSYSGIIKAGYEYIEWDFEEDDGETVINVTLPEATVLSHDFEFTEIDENNNAFNFPYGSEEYMSYEKEIKAEELKAAEEKGLYEEAESEMKNCIRNFVDQLEGYSVNFI